MRAQRDGRMSARQTERLGPFPLFVGPLDVCQAAGVPCVRITSFFFFISAGMKKKRFCRGLARGEKKQKGRAVSAPLFGHCASRIRDGQGQRNASRKKTHHQRNETCGTDKRRLVTRHSLGVLSPLLRRARDALFFAPYFSLQSRRCRGWQKRQKMQTTRCRSTPFFPCPPLSRFEIARFWNRKKIIQGHRARFGVVSVGRCFHRISIARRESQEVEVRHGRPKGTLNCGATRNRSTF